jgi:hypothetical protein
MLIRVLREKSDRILDGPSGQVVPVLFMGGYGNALWHSDG